MTFSSLAGSAAGGDATAGRRTGTDRPRRSRVGLLIFCRASAIFKQDVGHAY